MGMRIGRDEGTFELALVRKVRQKALLPRVPVSPAAAVVDGWLHGVKPDEKCQPFVQIETSMKSIPLLIIPFAVYNFFVFTGMEFINTKFFDLSSTYAMSGGALIVLVGVVLLCVDIVKSAVFARGSVAEQLLSIALLIACSIQVVIWPAVRTEWYVLLLALQATDVVASLVVSLQANGKDVYVNR